MKNKEWKLITRTHAIADTGDYDYHYELTNGDIVLITRDEVDSEIGGDFDIAVKLFNDCDYKWENWKQDDLQFQLYIEKTENEKIMKFIKSKGLLEEYYEIRR